MRLRKRQILAGGQARGRLLGGNLTVLAHLMGTRHAPDFRGAVLFLEEVGEEAYRIDRALTHLEQAGAFGNLSAVLLGNFSVPRTRRDFPPDRTLEALIAERFLTLGIPVISGLRAGHVPGKITLPLGGTARVDGAGAELRFAP